MGSELGVENIGVVEGSGWIDARGIEVGKG